MLLLLTTSGKASPFISIISRSVVVVAREVPAVAPAGPRNTPPEKLSETVRLFLLTAPAEPPAVVLSTDTSCIPRRELLISPPFTYTQESYPFQDCFCSSGNSITK